MNCLAWSPAGWSPAGELVGREAKRRFIRQNVCIIPEQLLHLSLDDRVIIRFVRGQYRVSGLQHGQKCCILPPPGHPEHRC